MNRNDRQDGLRSLSTAALLALALALLLVIAQCVGCTSVYVQTGDHGSIERSTDIERSVKGRSLEQPKRDDDKKEQEKP